MDSFDRDARLGKVTRDVTFGQDLPGTPTNTNTYGYSHPGMEQFGPRGQQVLEDAVRMQLGLIRPQMGPAPAQAPDAATMRALMQMLQQMSGSGPMHDVARKMQELK